MTYLSTPLQSPARTMTGIDLDRVFDDPYRKRVLIIDDDLDTVFLLKEILRTAGFDVVGALSGKEAIKKCSEATPDIILLDLMMPELDGFETFRYLRQMTGVPVIVVSAMSTKEDVVKGLQFGVDDYMTKPFYNAEVVARIKNVLRRAAPSHPVSRLVFPQVQLVIDLETQEVNIRNQPIRLTSREFSLLSLLATRASQNVGYSSIIKHIWGDEEDSPEVRARIKYLIYLLRQKLELDPSNPELIINIEGFGYKIQTESIGK